MLRRTQKILILSCVLSMQIALATSWERHYGTEGWDYGYAVQSVITADGYIVAGASRFGEHNWYGYLLKITETGDFAWARNYGNTLYSEILYSTANIPGTDGYYAVGEAWHNDYQRRVPIPYILKAEYMGSPVWETYEYDNGSSYYSIVLVSGTENYVVCGRKAIGTPGDYAFQACFAEYEGKNRIRLQYYQPPNDPPQDEHNRWEYTDARSIDKWYQGVFHDGYVMAGQTWFIDKNAGTINGQVFLLRVYLDGSGPQMETWGGTGDDIGYCIRQTADGGFIVVGSTTSYGAGGHDVYLIKTDQEFNVTWERTYGGPQDDIGYSIHERRNDNNITTGYIICGSTQSFGAGKTDVLLLSVDAAGLNPTYELYGSSAAHDYGFSIDLSPWEPPYSGFVITGNSIYEGIPVDDDDVYCIYEDFQSDNILSSAESAGEDGFNFIKISSSPAKRDAKIQFGSSDERKATVKLFDIAGRLVEVLFEGNVSDGVHEILYNCEHLSGGIYFVKYEAGDYIKTTKMTLIR